jgi:paraquat-inducible protein B
MKRIRYIFAATLSASLLVLTPVVAAAADSTASSTLASPSTTTTVPTTATNRLAANKAALKTALTAAQTARIKLKCQTAQGIVKIANTRTTTNAPLREQNYADVQAAIAKLIPKLNALDIDTTALVAEQTTLSAKATQIKTDYASYKEQLGDVEAIDCLADSIGFQANTNAARTTHDKLITDFTDIKTYVTGTIKPTITHLRAEVAAKASTTTTTGGNQ